MYFQVESVIEFEPGLNNYTAQLYEMKDAQARVYLLYARYQNKYSSAVF